MTNPTDTTPAALERLCEILRDMRSPLAAEAAAVIAALQAEIGKLREYETEYVSRLDAQQFVINQADAKLREIAGIADAALTGDAEHDYTRLHRIRSIARTAGEKDNG